MLSKTALFASLVILESSHVVRGPVPTKAMPSLPQTLKRRKHVPEPASPRRGQSGANAAHGHLSPSTAQHRQQ